MNEELKQAIEDVETETGTYWNRLRDGIKQQEFTIWNAGLLEGAKVTLRCVELANIPPMAKIRIMQQVQVDLDVAKKDQERKLNPQQP